MSVFAYFGPAGTFTEMALDKILATETGAAGVPRRDDQDDVRKIAAASPAAAIAMVRSGEVDFACVPIESSLEGSVPATMDALVPDGVSRVQVVAETVLDVAFAIAAPTAIDAAQVKRIAAYPVASAQVRLSVDKLYPGAEFVIASSNAGAAQDVSEGKADAAVTTRLAAELSGLTVIADEVSDAVDATTRFLLVGRPVSPPPRTGTDRTAVILELPNEPGSLMSAMNQFASRGIDLTRIESRPRRDPATGESNPGQYRFFLDAVGHIDDDAVAEALQALFREADRIVYLGSWTARGVIGSPPPDQAASSEWVSAMRRGTGDVDDVEDGDD
ncbi:prephenate dehydratase [Gordonia otitidis]|uniref:Prephenate dehydratase n=1 Tax=Gordonia otitidis (strain DSM 44809 / CCUG 52243 / JCM 12355 / NBRC 100426 / IFM 10032) TaxID=1108044 RepID=H5TR17_GORO1|nr:prephenate dehydratase [Gordonia otitidis]GAB35925.1 prephenate dehydratase [Gordonia otitidis NBRC 100426]